MWAKRATADFATGIDSTLFRAGIVWRMRPWGVYAVMEFRDYYKILGVSPDATADEIKRAYRKLARQYHPDVSHDANAEERFKEINEAYDALKDPKRRQAYDQRDANAFDEGRYGAGGFDPFNGWSPDFDNIHGSYSDEAFGGDFEFSSGDDTTVSDFFESLFGVNRATSTQERRYRTDADTGDMVDVFIALEDSYFGRDRLIEIAGLTDNAPHSVPERRKIQFTVPKGITAGQTIRLKGQGYDKPGSGIAHRRDLLLKVNFDEHALYTSDDRDIHLDVPVAPWEIALGATITVPTLGGPVFVDIKAGAKNGQKMRLKGRGLPGRTPGDQIITLRAEIPEARTAKVRELYEQLEKETSFEPRKQWAN